MGHRVPEIVVVAQAVVLQEGEHRGAVPRRVEDQDQDADVCFPLVKESP